MKFSQLLKVLGPSLLSSSLMLVVLVLIMIILPSSFSKAVVLILSTTLGAGLYLAASWITNREQLKELWGLARQKEGNGRIDER